MNFKYNFNFIATFKFVKTNLTLILYYVAAFTVASSLGVFAFYITGKPPFVQAVNSLGEWIVAASGVLPQEAPPLPENRLPSPNIHERLPFVEYSISDIGNCICKHGLRVCNVPKPQDSPRLYVAMADRFYLMFLETDRVLQNGRFVKAGTLAIIKPALFFVPEIGAYVMVGSFTLVPGENMGELGTGLCFSKKMYNE